ncbi:glycosyltransferase family 2 protein [bacterium]|uniref:Glycosyltransferase 2-like domain-containing protein n=2 Tax=Katanobacteria TaxID=422282 RepID=A0A2M7X2B1_UNCKA|nr:glycosyltransferase family 2 protein [bacterium]PIP56709.1 MAG: hypothetical protein COX05_01675 [candidate division WWE3 bacterium CG22_combo_CG10-13_8_21_14_all_39_12]PJA40314.1 MAG: hypothetical protein CO179_02635 [candidate division WWE3 bacterium CG_4_9_14_3_um_filter_39_7]
MQNKSTKSHIDRIFEMVPGILTWLVLTSPVWLALNLPFAMAYGIIFLDVYWLYRAFKSATYSILGYRIFKKVIKVDWWSKLKHDFPDEHSTIEHLLIIPTYKEPEYVIRTTFEGIANSEYDLSHVRVVLALEQREDPELKVAKKKIAEEFSHRVAAVYVTEHPGDIEGEVVGPGSNRTWSLNHLWETLEKDIDIDNTILTTLDADFVVHQQFLAGLTHKYLSTENVRQRSFTGVFMYSNNYWQAPAPMRIIASSHTINQLAELVEPWKYVIFSSHSLNLRTLKELGFWSTDHVNDDSRLYWNALYHFKGDFEVVPHWLPVYGDTVLDDTLGKSFTNQYKQLQRWAYGVEHRPFIYKMTLSEREMPLIKRLERLLFVVRADLIWATIAYITGFGALILVAVNGYFRETVLGTNLVFYSGIILTFAILGLLPTAILNHKLFPPMPHTWSRLRRFIGNVQLLMTPLILMTFGTLPAIDSQTRLMFGKYLSFRVTRKHRKDGKRTVIS